MADYDEDETFYEEDESAEEIFAKFDWGEKEITAPFVEPPKTFGSTQNTITKAVPVSAPVTSNPAQEYARAS